ncbi:hypothetical protein BG004_004845 [Podila humilis]|nr:hypothetical protein BG004_004845 [Podila humilis]
MFRLSTRITSNSAQAVQCVRELAMANRTGLTATIGSANVSRMRAMGSVLANSSASYSSVPRQMTQQMSLKEVGIMGITLGMCWKLKDFGITGRFLGESEEAYIGMNEAFAKGDRKYLEEICTPTMYAKLKGQLKDRVGRYEWRYHGIIGKPQIVSIRQGQIGGHVLIQMIVRLNSNQSMAVYDKKNKVIAGDLKKPVPVLEYIVFQRYITDPEDNWKILGKTAPTEST